VTVKYSYCYNAPLAINITAGDCMNKEDLSYELPRFQMQFYWPKAEYIAEMPCNSPVKFKDNSTGEEFGLVLYFVIVIPDKKHSTDDLKVKFKKASIQDNYLYSNEFMKVISEDIIADMDFMNELTNFAWSEYLQNDDRQGLGEFPTNRHQGVLSFLKPIFNKITKISFSK